MKNDLDYDANVKLMTSFPSAYLLEENVSWEDLVISSSTMKQLKQIPEHIKARSIMTGRGGKKLSGPASLFVGPSGTGKTFAASIIARELGWPLFRVDLGRLVSKYIGETEKNINAVFNAANDKNMVLFFDVSEVSTYCSEFGLG